MQDRGYSSTRVGNIVNLHEHPNSLTWPCLWLSISNTYIKKKTLSWQSSWKKCHIIHLSFVQLMLHYCISLESSQGHHTISENLIDWVWRDGRIDFFKSWTLSLGVWVKKISSHSLSKRGQCHKQLQLARESWQEVNNSATNHQHGYESQVSGLISLPKPTTHLPAT